LSRPLSIGIVCFSSLGGSGTVATELAAGLSERGHTVHVIVGAPLSRILPRSERLLVHEVSVPRHPALVYAPYGLALASSLVQLTSAHRLDVVHVHYAIPHAISAYLARQMLGAGAPRIVVTLHGSDVTQIGSDPGYLPTTRFAVGQADGVTVPSEFLRAEAHARLGLDASLPIEVIPNFVDTERFAPARGRDRAHFDAMFEAAGGDPADRGSPVLFHVSSFRPVKRVTDLVEVLARVRRHVRARLVLIGDGPEREPLLDRARALGVTRSILPLGTQAEFVSHLRNADAFLFPSESESFGVAALEALSCGVPVVAYRVGGIPEVVTEEAGRLIEPYNLDAMAERTLELLTSPGLRDELGTAARARAESRFQRDAAIDRYENHYRRVLERTSSEAV
jgi:N-acetyl-alpha-D-glucosaminyl L-malate synthase BshA